MEGTQKQVKCLSVPCGPPLDDLSQQAGGTKAWPSAPGAGASLGAGARQGQTSRPATVLKSLCGAGTWHIAPLHTEDQRVTAHFSYGD